MKSITMEEIDKIIAQGRAVRIYPRKKVVSIDGYKTFKIKDYK